MIVDFSQVKKETLKVAPLEMGQGDPHASRLRVPMMFDLYFLFFLKKEKKEKMVVLKQSCINFHV